jgi:predicted Kef-type K+ transport protein
MSSLCLQVQISLVVWMFQYPPRTAAAVGLSMAQIGEFAFVLLSSASQHGLLAYQVYMLLMGACCGRSILRIQLAC